ncbi:MAG: repeat domain protein [Gemmatimonadetes bacterium]|nr:repeat domain protein [Gemmatimonadota bacterium]
MRARVLFFLAAASAGCGDPTSASVSSPDAEIATPDAAIAADAGTDACEPGTCAPAPSPPRDVKASTDIAEHVLVTWLAPSAGTPSGYVVQRDGSDLASFGAGITSYADESAEPGEPGPPTTLTASEGTRTDGVLLTWSSSTTPGPSHTYTVVAVFDDLRRASAPATGHRSGAVVAHEISRDDGQTWFREDSGASTFLDVGAPLGTISTAATQLENDYPRAYVRLRAGAGIDTSAPPPSVYRVRALATTAPTSPSVAATGWRGVGRPAFQWQRSTDDIDASYTDLPSVTGSLWYDASAPLDVGRYYRARISADGAAPTMTIAARAVRWSLKELRAGDDQSCAIRSDDRVACWGWAYGSPVPTTTPSFDTFSQLSVGSWNSGNVCAARIPTGVTCWGSLSSSVPADLATVAFKKVATGQTHACGIDADDHLRCWGDNRYGQALPGPSADTVRDVSVGDRFTCVLDADSKLRCVGDAQAGQPVGPTAEAYSSTTSVLGSTCAIGLDSRLKCFGGIAYQAPPTDLVSAVALNGHQACALLLDGRRICWLPQPTFAPAGPSSGSYAMLALGGAHACALRTDGTPECLGRSLVAPPMPIQETFTKVAAGENFSCGLLPSGAFQCWGEAPVAVSPPGFFRDLSAGPYSLCALRDDEKLVCWGVPGLASNGTPSVDTFRSVSLRYHTCGLRTDGKILCWGPNLHGEAPPGPSVAAYKAVATAQDVSCAIAMNDTLVCFGSDTWGHVSTAPAGKFVDVALGRFHACAIRTDGSLVCWGRAASRPPTNLPGRYKRLALSDYASCAIRDDGALTCWSEFDGVPVFPDAFTEVAYGSSHACALRGDGRAICWGNNEKRQAPSPESTRW